MGRLSIYFIKPFEAFFISAILTVFVSSGLGFLVGELQGQVFPQSDFPVLSYALFGTFYFLIFAAPPSGIVMGLCFAGYYIWAGKNPMKGEPPDPSLFFNARAVAWSLLAGVLMTAVGAVGLSHSMMPPSLGSLLFASGFFSVVCVLLIFTGEILLRFNPSSPSYLVRTAWLPVRVSVVCAFIDAAAAFCAMLPLAFAGVRITRQSTWAFALLWIYLLVAKPIFGLLVMRYFMRANLRACGK